LNFGVWMQNHLEQGQPKAANAPSDFGAHRPNNFLCWLISLSQRAPQNFIGQQFAQLVRKLVLLFASLPIDISIGLIKMRCYLRDNASEKKFVFMPWRFDKRERQALVDALPKNGTFIDIGANVGIYTLTAATHLGKHGRIVALEPNPPAHKRLSFNLKATQSTQTDWPQIDALQFGVADVESTLDLHLVPSNLGGSSIASHNVSSSPQAREVTRIICKPLLSILAAQGITKIDALKIDIEGAEDIALMPFLANATDDQLPKVIIIENSEKLWKQDLTAAIKGRGFEVQMRSRMNTVYRRA